MTRIMVACCLILTLLLIAVDLTDSLQARMTGYSLREYPGAMCLDGTPGMYYHFPGTGDGISKWYIEMQGGGWCGDFDHCLDRADTQHGSSSTWPPLQTVHTPFFSDDPKENSLLHNWNKVYFRYCDGFGFSGNVSDPVERGGAILHMRGHTILEAGIDDMLHKRDLCQATDVVVGGCSAGGLATFWHCDRWAERIQRYSPAVKVACAPQSGFFMDYKGKSDRPTYNDLMKEAFEFHQPVLSHNCLDKEQSSPLKCVFAENAVQYMTTPVFVMQPIFDSWARGAIRLSDNDPIEINKFGVSVVERVLSTVMDSSATSDQNGVFLDSCKRHCGGYDVRIGGTSKTEALAKWYKREAQKSVYVQHEEYYCEVCCDASLGPLPPSSSPSVSTPSSVWPTYEPLEVGPFLEGVHVSNGRRTGSSGTAASLMLLLVVLMSSVLE